MIIPWLMGSDAEMTDIPSSVDDIDVPPVFSQEFVHKRVAALRLCGSGEDFADYWNDDDGDQEDMDRTNAHI